MKFKSGERVRFENKKNVIDPRNGEECIVRSPITTEKGATIPIEFHDGAMGLAFEHELTPILDAEAYIQVTFEKGHVLNSKITTATELVEELGSVQSAKESWETVITMIKDIGELETLNLILRDGSTVGINPKNVTYACVMGGEKVLDELERMQDESA